MGVTFLALALKPLPIALLSVSIPNEDKPFFPLDGEVRLHGSNKINEGRVEVKLGGIWGTVSEKDWDIRDGHVVCRQLGYRHAVRVYSHSR